mmetsp:Transcript_40972/g.130951  ORF Transcript_40972/g.130951 Transcript_40972/m.130951 type:complete len:144 (-) Transcript_40972:719-1150(-)
MAMPLAMPLAGGLGESCTWMRPRMSSSRVRVAAGRPAARSTVGVTAKLNVPPSSEDRGLSWGRKTFRTPSSSAGKGAGLLDTDDLPEEVRKALVSRQRNSFKPGANVGAETWNGRMAMVAVTIALAIELATGQGPLSYLGILG